MNRYEGHDWTTGEIITEAALDNLSASLKQVSDYLYDSLLPEVFDNKKNYNSGDYFINDQDGHVYQFNDDHSAGDLGSNEATIIPKATEILDNINNSFINLQNNIEFLKTNVGIYEQTDLSLNQLRKGGINSQQTTNTNAKYCTFGPKLYTQQAQITIKINNTQNNIYFWYALFWDENNNYLRRQPTNSSENYGANTTTTINIHDGQKVAIIFGKAQSFQTDFRPEITQHFTCKQHIGPVLDKTSNMQIFDLKTNLASLPNQIIHLDYNYSKSIANSVSYDNILEAGTYIGNLNNQPLPTQLSHTLIVNIIGNNIIAQIIIDAAGKIYTRGKNGNNDWSEWTDLLSQVTEIQTNISNLKNALNLFESSTANYLDGYNIASDGSLVAATGYSVSELIKYTWNGYAQYHCNDNTRLTYKICFYDSSLTKLNNFQNPSSIGASAPRSINAETQVSGTPAYVRFSFLSGTIGKIVFSNQTIWEASETAYAPTIRPDIKLLQNNIAILNNNMNNLINSVSKPFEGSAAALSDAVPGTLLSNINVGINKPGSSINITTTSSSKFTNLRNKVIFYKATPVHQEELQIGGINSNTGLENNDKYLVRTGYIDTNIFPTDNIVNIIGQQGSNFRLYSSHRYTYDDEEGYKLIEKGSSLAGVDTLPRKINITGSSGIYIRLTFMSIPKKDLSNLDLTMVIASATASEHSLGSNIYGGNLIFNTGTLIQTHAMVELNNSNVEYIGDNIFKVTGISPANEALVSNQLYYIDGGQTDRICWLEPNGDDFEIRFKVSGISSVSNLINYYTNGPIQIVYRLITPTQTTIPLSKPLLTMTEGTNYFWVNTNQFSFNYESYIYNDINIIKNNITDIATNIDNKIDLVEDTLAEDISDLESVAQTTQNAVEGLSTRMTAAEGDIDALESAVGNSGLGGRMTTAEVNITSHGTRLTTAESDINALEAVTRAMVYPDLSALSATEKQIANETNYDTLMTPGTYLIKDNETAKSMINCPTILGHRLIVGYVTGGARAPHLLQIVIDRDGSGNSTIYRRMYSPGNHAFGNWVSNDTRIGALETSTSGLNTRLTAAEDGLSLPDDIVWMNGSTDVYGNILPGDTETYPVYAIIYDVAHLDFTITYSQSRAMRLIVGSYRADGTQIQREAKLNANAASKSGSYDAPADAAYVIVWYRTFNEENVLTMTGLLRASNISKRSVDMKNIMPKSFHTTWERKTYSDGQVQDSDNKFAMSPVLAMRDGDTYISTNGILMRLVFCEDGVANGVTSQWTSSITISSSTFNPHRNGVRITCRLSGDAEFPLELCERSVFHFGSNEELVPVEKYDPIVPILDTEAVITAESGKRYLCGTLTSLSFTPCNRGLCEVIFTCGSTPTVLILPSTVKMPDWWTGLQADRTYDIMIMDGTYGVVTSWAI